MLALASAPLLLASAEGDFRPLFDGATLEGWQIQARPGGAGGWTAEQGELRVEGRPGNLSTVAEFGDFELRLEWRIEQLGNSGVFYRVAGNGNPASSAIEFQIADPARPASQQHADRLPGAAYGLYAPTGDAARPPGQWNAMRIVARGPRVEHWLNGRKVVEVDLASEAFARRAEAAGKAAGFAQAKRGRIVLQDHASSARFRNLRIRKLD